MTKDQRQDLYVEWDLYDPTQKWKITVEYFSNGGAYCQESWENYLKDKLEIEGVQENGWVDVKETSLFAKK